MYDKMLNTIREINLQNKILIRRKKNKITFTKNKFLSYILPAEMGRFKNKSNTLMFFLAFRKKKLTEFLMK